MFFSLISWKKIAFWTDKQGVPSLNHPMYIVKQTNKKQKLFTYISRKNLQINPEPRWGFKKKKIKSLKQRKRKQLKKSKNRWKSCKNLPAKHHQMKQQIYGHHLKSKRQNWVRQKILFLLLSIPKKKDFNQETTKITSLTEDEWRKQDEMRKKWCVCVNKNRGKWENKNERKKERGKEVAWPGRLKRGDNNL